MAMTTAVTGIQAREIKEILLRKRITLSFKSKPVFHRGRQSRWRTAAKKRRKTAQMRCTKAESS
jgi:hypothetical protein